MTLEELDQRIEAQKARLAVRPPATLPTPVLPVLPTFPKGSRCPKCTSADMVERLYHTPVAHYELHCRPCGFEWQELV